jgi:thymidylate synthase (FAD)
MKIDVLDHGYVRLVNSMGSEVDIANAARVSYDKEVINLEEKDKKLIKYLIKHHHDSTLRHNVMTFEVYAPLMVARQWWKHHVGSTHVEEQNGWNESSRRYITEEPVFYVPEFDEWREKAASNKQGSGGPVSKDTGVMATKLLQAHAQKSLQLYDDAMARGISPEQARMFLPAYSMYVRWRWTASLNAILSFLELRQGETAQDEITKYANAVAVFVQGQYPITMEAWNAR